MTESESNDRAHGDGEARQTNLGELLRQARERRETTVEDLARSLRLSPRLVHSLERNDFDRIAAPAFVRGYIRSIAKELGIDSEPLVTAFDLRTSAEPALSDFESRAPIQINADSRIIRYTTAGLVAAMALLVALWWRSNEGARDAPPPDAALETADTPPLAYEFDIVEHPVSPYFRADPPAAADILAPSPDGEAVDAPAAEPAPPVGDAATAVSVSASEEAWLEVRDAAGERLHFGFVRPDKAVKIEGQPPFVLIIGNAPVVSVTVDGEAVDFGPFMVEGVARFELAAATARALPQPAAVAGDE